MLNGLFGKSGVIGTVGAALIGPKVLDPCRGDISSLAVHVEASRMGLDITGLGGGLATTGGVTSSVFSLLIKALILFCTVLFVRLTEGLVFGLVLAVEGTTGNGGALLRTDFKTP